MFLKKFQTTTNKENVRWRICFLLWSNNSLAFDALLLNSMPFIDPWFHQFVLWNVDYFTFSLKSSVEIASLTMWLISYICIIVCTLNCFKTSVNDIVWIRGMSTFSAIDQKRKISIKKLELLVYQTKNFICAFVYLIYVSD